MSESEKRLAEGASITISGQQAALFMQQWASLCPCEPPKVGWALFFSFHSLVNTTALVRCQRRRHGFWANHFVTREEERKKRKRERKKEWESKGWGEGNAAATLTLNLPFSAKFSQPNSWMFANTIRFLILLHDSSRRSKCAFNWIQNKGKRQRKHTWSQMDQNEVPFYQRTWGLD